MKGCATIIWISQIDFFSNFTNSPSAEKNQTLHYNFIPNVTIKTFKKLWFGHNRSKLDFKKLIP